MSVEVGSGQPVNDSGSSGCSGCVLGLMWCVAAVVAVVLFAADLAWLGIVVLALMLLAHFLARAATTSPSEVESAARTSTKGTSQNAYSSPRPTGQAVPPWLNWPFERVEVVGEAYRDGIARLYPKGEPIDDDGGRELHVDAVLADDSANPYDTNAVSVWQAGEHVGFLDRGLAASWSPLIRRLRERGEVLQVGGRLWMRPRGKGGYYARSTVLLPDRRVIWPVNELPSRPFVILPTGGRVQVTKEDAHMDVLGTLVDPGGPVPVVATLHAVEEVRPRSVIEAVEVRIDGARVGILSPTMSGHMLPLVKYIEDRAKTAVARAEVSGSRLKADVTLHVARAGDVDHEWLDSLGPVPSQVAEREQHVARTAAEPDGDAEVEAQQEEP